MSRHEAALNRCRSVMDEMKIYRRRPSMKKIAFCAIASSLLVLATAANARSAYDGSWNLVFVTRSGACDATYDFTVDISNGIVTHPNLVKLRGMSPDRVQFARPSLFRINTR